MHQPKLSSAEKLNYLQALNPHQREAVEIISGPLLILAGAGTGKTRVLTTRYVHIMHTQNIHPSQILAVTFTNKAALEMKERIAKLTSHPLQSAWIGTFHSIAVRILRRHGPYIHLQPNFTIIDQDDQIRLVRQIIKDFKIDEKKYSPKSVAHAIGVLKDKAIDAEQAKSYEDSVIVHIYKDYQERLKILNAVDFGDLLLNCLQLFSQHPDVLEYYKNQFKYILVDEYQDTNVSQYIWLRLLAQSASKDSPQNICCVGDDDQSIYGWRGAEVGNILRFEKDFLGAKIIRLEQNYRSTTAILGVANQLIACNKSRYSKKLWSNKEAGEPVKIHSHYDGEEEARFIGSSIESLQNKGYKLSNMAILVRASFQTRTFEDTFMRIGIPYRVIGGPRFYERMEIRDCLAYLRLLVQPNDGLAFERIINTPRRGIGDTTIQRLHQYAREHNISLPQAADIAAHTKLDEIPLQGKARTALQTFFKDFSTWRELIPTSDPINIVRRVLDESGYTQIWLVEKTEESRARIENIKELVQAIGQFETIQGFLEHVSLVMDTNNTNTEEMVNIMTLHSAKGLEFDHVFLSGWEEGLFPHQRSFNEGNAGIEEERRLAYVGISRAKITLTITYAYSRRMPQGWQQVQPSRFIKEIMHSSVHHYTPSGGLTSSYQHQAQANDQTEKKYSLGYANRPSVSKGKSASSLQKNYSHDFKTGDQVQHTIFGLGDVIAFEGQHVLVSFKNGQLHKIMADYLQKK